MVKEIGSQYIAGIILVTLVISLGGTFLVVSKISAIQSFEKPLFTGMATNEQTGEALIAFATNIQISLTNNSIDFGDCVYNASAVEASWTISSNMTEADINSTSRIACSDSNLDSVAGGVKSIVVANTGNIDANVTIYTDAIGSDVLGAGGVLRIMSTQDGSKPGCEVTANITSDWEPFTISGSGNRLNVCSNLTRGANNKVAVWVNWTIPNTASTDATGNTDAGLTLFAEDTAG